MVEIPGPPRVPGQCRVCLGPMPQGPIRPPRPGQPPKDRTVCDNPTCQTRARLEAQAESAANVPRTGSAWLERARARTDHMLEAALAQVGAEDRAEIAYGFAPFIDPGLEPLSPERRAAFEAHLDRILAEAFAEEPIDPTPLRTFEVEDHADFDRRDRQTEPGPPALDAACIACQGDCCTQAYRAHAFLTERSIAYVRHRWPEATPDEIRDAYLSRLPEQGVRKSCIFHGPVGCTLPREIRADVCNRFDCSFRKALARELDEKGLDRAVAVGLSDDHEEHPEEGAPSARVVSVTPEGIRIHDDLVLGPLPPRRR